MRTNLSKSSISPIRFSEQHLDLIAATLPCTISDFPCKYLGLPLSIAIGKPRKSDFQPLIDKVIGRLPSWQANMLLRGGRLVVVKSVLTTIPLYTLMVLQAPSGSSNKRRRVFLWKGKNDVVARHCLVAWQTVCRPTQFGGLGIHNLQVLDMALWLRWLWLQRTCQASPCQGLPF